MEQEKLAARRSPSYPCHNDHQVACQGLHPRFALPGRLSLHRADCILQRSLIYSPSGSVFWSLPDQAWSPMHKKGRGVVRG